MLVVGAVVWLASVLTATDAIGDNYDLEGLNVGDLRDMIRELLSEASIPHTCLDSSQYNDCHRVVEARLCAADDFYARYCCRSCIRAGQVPPYGRHVEGEGEAPLTVKVNASATKVMRGQKVTITCSASGYPEPEIAWLRDSKTPIFGDKYNMSVTHDDAPLLRTVTSTLTLAEFTPEDHGSYGCVGVNVKGSHYDSARLEDAGKLQLKLLTRPQYVLWGDEIAVECEATALEPPTISWQHQQEDIPPGAPERTDVVSTDDAGLTKVFSRIHWKSFESWMAGNYVCRANTTKGQEDDDVVLRSFSNHIREQIPEDCADHDPELCYYGKGACSYRETVKRLCCRTCLQSGQGLHSGRTTELYDTVSAEMLPGTENGPRVGKYGGSVFMTCEAETYPDPVTITWLKDGTPIQHSAKYRITERYLINYAYENELGMKLEVRDVNLSDLGNYTCRTHSGPLVGEDTMTLWISYSGDLKLT